MKNLEKGNLKESGFFGKSFWYFVLIAVALIVALNLSVSMKVILTVVKIISPFILGFAIAFLLNIPMMFFEKKVFSFMEKKKNKVWSRCKRFVSLLITIAIIYIVLSTLGIFIYREVAKCISDFAENATVYAKHLQNMIYSVTNVFADGFLVEQVEKINWVTLIEKTGAALASVSPNIINWTIGLTSAVFNFFLAVIFALYLLFGKENILRHIKRTMYAYFNRSVVDKLRNTALLARDTFADFTVGQLTETLILMVMYFIGTNVARLPYPALISVLMGIGGIIPVFGPIITAIPSVIIILMVGGINEALIFAVMAIAFQQIESNIIYPKVIGNSIGLPGIWVLLSVLVGSAVGGMVGMIVAVPAVSVIYKLVRKDVRCRLKEKNIDDCVIDGIENEQDDIDSEKNSKVKENKKGNKEGRN